VKTASQIWNVVKNIKNYNTEQRNNWKKYDTGNFISAKLIQLPNFQTATGWIP